MTLSEIVKLLTLASGALSAEGTQSLFKTTADGIERHLANEGYSLDKLRANQSTIPEPVFRTDQKDEE